MDLFAIMTNDLYCCWKSLALPVYKTLILTCSVLPGNTTIEVCATPESIPTHHHQQELRCIKSYVTTSSVRPVLEIYTILIIFEIRGWVGGWGWVVGWGGGEGVFFLK